MNLQYEQIACELINHSLKPSHQRIKIYEYLASHFVHPNADQVYDCLKKGMPTLSRSTVYSTLKAFVNAGLLRDITIEENEIRYEFNLQDHGHFKCSQCGAIYDFDIDLNGFKSNHLSDFKITNRNVYFQGICKKCLDGLTEASELR
ncbi:MAG TPA: Fur family transcriptional regulator [Bacillota bacterium]|nr:Fur family transcriptional regulator [Bacillota bacterium]